MALGVALSVPLHERLMKAEIGSQPVMFPECLLCAGGDPSLDWDNCELARLRWGRPEGAPDPARVGSIKKSYLKP